MLKNFFKKKTPEEKLEKSRNKKSEKINALGKAFDDFIKSIKSSPNNDLSHQSNWAPRAILSNLKTVLEDVRLKTQGKSNKFFKDVMNDLSKLDKTKIPQGCLTVSGAISQNPPEAYAQYKTKITDGLKKIFKKERLNSLPDTITIKHLENSDKTSKWSDVCKAVEDFIENIY